MSLFYHLWLNEEVKGPFTINQVQTMWNAGQLTVEDQFTTDVGENWRPLSEIVWKLEPEPDVVTPKIVVPAIQDNPAPNERKRLAVLLILLVVGGLIAGLWFYGTASQVTTSKPIMPTEIKLALNNLKSGIDTGVDLDTYSNDIIALKSSIATYGDKIGGDKTIQLAVIVGNLETTLKIWKNSDSRGDYAMEPDSPLLGWFQQLKIEPEEDTYAERVVSAFSSDHANLKIFKSKDVVSKAWGVIGSEIDQLLTSN